MGKIEVLRLLDLYLKRIGSGTFNLVSKEVVTDPVGSVLLPFPCLYILRKLHTCYAALVNSL
jgi:hypothetical protein